MEKVIVIIKDEKAEKWPYRVLIDGKKDPRNREFEDIEDVKQTFEELQKAGFYEGYSIISKVL